MSSCGNCDCSDKTNCPKKGNGYGVEIIQAEKSHGSVEMMAGAENDGKCKCGPNCTCTTCTCGH